MRSCTVLDFLPVLCHNTGRLNLPLMLQVLLTKEKWMVADHRRLIEIVDTFAEAQENPYTRWPDRYPGHWATDYSCTLEELIGQEISDQAMRDLHLGRGVPQRVSEQERSNS